MNVNKYHSNQCYQVKTNIVTFLFISHLNDFSIYNVFATFIKHNTKNVPNDLLVRGKKHILPIHQKCSGPVGSGPARRLATAYYSYNIDCATDS